MKTRLVIIECAGSCFCEKYNIRNIEGTQADLDFG